MGATLHKESNQSMMEDLTPESPADNVRRLHFDPRSPTDNITRTPIIVEKTPDNALETADPRSPTVGIDRTPLVVLMKKGSCPTCEDRMEVVSTPTRDLAPLCVAEESEERKSHAEERDRNCMGSPPSSPDPDTLRAIPLIDQFDGSPLLTMPQVLPASMEPTPLQPKVASYPKKLFSPQPAAAKGPDARPTEPRPQSAPAKGPGVRPLGLAMVDPNSPRSILQTKQRRQASKALGAPRARSNHADKENMIH